MGIRKDIKTSELMEMRVRGLSYDKIAALTGLSKTAVRYRIKGCLKALDADVDIYKRNRSTILTAVEKKIIDEIASPKKIKRASLSNLAYAFKQLFDANRLEQGLSTQNIAYKEILARKEEIQARIRELEEKLKMYDENEPAIEAEKIEEED